LARPGRALDRERAVLERRDEPARRSNAVLLLAAQGPARVAFDARRPSQEQIARRPVGAWGVDALLHDPPAEAEKGRGELVRVHGVVGKDARRVHTRARAALLDVDGVRAEIDGDDPAEILIERQRELQRVALADARLLRREPVAVR